MTRRARGRRGGRAPLTAAAFAVLCAVALLAGAGGRGDVPAPPRAGAGCLACHGGIEEMHPWHPLGCTDCHGGDGDAPTIERAHVAVRGWPTDERVRPEGFDPAAARFVNPTDLRIVDTTCGACHAADVDRLRKSLHGTTAGHLCDGLYENGVLDERGSVYGIFAVRDDDGATGDRALAAVESIARLATPRGRTGADRSGSLGDHFADLPRKACMQCHLYEAGVAVRGRLGQDGLYRGAGCAACHVSYAEDGLSRSADPTVDRFEPGHPIRHTLTPAPPTDTCVRCHVGDASIGNAFRGLAQLYPNQPAGAEVPGTTDRLVANQFFVQDPLLTPPDLHHAAGLQCIDCHTAGDVMGDGDIHGAMEHAVEIECVDCHGTFTERATLRTARGTRLTHLERAGDMVVLRGKLDGRARRVAQAADVIDPGHPDYNPRAAAAMTPEHARLECYACHGGWSTNFFGFHFDRHLGFSQLDLVTGRRTPGRVSTQERVFATLRQLVLGVNPEGMVAPYMVGFSTMGTVHGADGELLVDQGLPETAAGLSGMSMIHHQLHTTQRAARSCVECHRSPATYGLGAGGSFSLARGYVFAVGERGLDTILLDRENPDRSVYLARLPLGGARRIALDAHPVTGHAETAFVVVEHAGVVVVDVRNPAFPEIRAFVAAGDARDVVLAGDLLVVANGVAGVRVVDVSDRDQPVLVSDVRTTEARGLSLQWPRVLVADGPGGLLAVDLSVPRVPRVAGRLALDEPGGQLAADATAVASIFQYGRPQGHDERTPARLLAVVANGERGLAVVDATEPTAMQRLFGAGGQYRGGGRVVDVSVTSRFDLGDTAGLRPTVERDVAYVLVAGETAGGQVRVLDLSAPSRPVVLDTVALPDTAGYVRGGALVKSFNPPVLVSRYVVATELEGLRIVDVTQSDAAALREQLPGVDDVHAVAAESFAFDRMVDETGSQLKDISHAGARFLDAAEIHRVLSVPPEALALVDGAGEVRARLHEAFGGSAAPGGRPDAARAPDAVAPDAEREERLAGGFRLAPREDAARLVRHVDPRAYDGGGDGALSRPELQRLLFEVLDANGDGRLDALEWPRHPGQDPGALDRNGDGSVARSEMEVGDEVLRFFDVDGSGRVELVEWPWYVFVEPLPSLLYAEAGTLLRLVRRRPALYRALFGDDTPTTAIDDAAVSAILDRARAAPLSDPTGQSAPPDMLQRWDIDGDGEIDADEYAPLPRIAPRCDVDGDGRLSAGDRPGH